MTRNQIDAYNAKENAYHNRQMERYNDRSLAETARHNVAGEQETQRHNKVTEFETHRYNTNVNRTNWANINENIRHNEASERISRDANDLNYSAKIYAANKSAETSKQVAMINSETATRTATIGSSASQYGANLAYRSSIYGTDVNKGIAAANRRKDIKIAKLNNSSREKIEGMKSLTQIGLKGVDVATDVTKISKIAKVLGSLKSKKVS